MSLVTLFYSKARGPKEHCSGDQSCSTLADGTIGAMLHNEEWLYLSLYGTQKFESYFFSLTDQLIMQWPQSATLTKQKLTHYINRGFLTGHQAAETAKKLWFTDVLYQFKIYLPNQKKYVKFTFFKNFKKG